MYGSGSIILTNNPVSSGLAPLALQNGLSVVGARGELGLRPLLHDTFIERAGYDFRINNATNPNFIINNAGLFMCQFGDINNIQDGINMQMFSLNGAVNQFVIQDPLASYIVVDTLAGLSSIGSNAVGSWQLELSQFGRLIRLINGAGTITLLNFNENTDVYRIGKDTLSTFTIGTNSFEFFNPGTDISDVLRMSNTVFAYGNGQSKAFFNINIPGRIYQLGDINTTFGGTYLNITDAALTGNFDFKNNGPSIFNIAAAGIKTFQPSANGAGLWQLGKKLAAAVILDAANYIEVKIDNVIYKLALVN